MDYIITTRQLTKRYKNFTSVNNVSLHIQKGSIYGFLGPNGAGKSTTMKMLLGLTAPTKGSFIINGKHFPDDRIAILKEIGSFIESPSFYANLTGRENLDIIRRILGLPKDAVEDALQLVGLTESGGRLAKKYSLGMKQRLGIACAFMEAPDIILLDINMPGMDGLALCRAIRDHVTCPILFLTARIEEADRVAGLRAGGDDYILKPFSLAELTARVEAHLRRESRIQQKISVRGFGDIVVDYAARTVSRNGQPIELSKVEFDIVELLSLHPGQVFSRETIYEQVRGFDGTADNAVVKEHIRRIRNKLGAQYIETVWGCGYKWAK